MDPSCLSELLSSPEEEVHRHEDSDDRSGHCEAGFSGSRSRQEREGCVPPQVEAERSCPVFCRIGAVHGRDGSQWKRSLLGTGADWVWSHGKAHGASVCEALRQVEQERCQRCRGHRGSSDPAPHAFCSSEVSSAAGPAVSAPRTQPAGCEPDSACQPDPRFVGRVWDCAPATCGTVAQRVTIRAGRCRKPAHRFQPSALPRPL